MDNQNSERSEILPIGAYAIIGDCHTAALVSRGGCIDWYCPGRFDGPAVFCRLLDLDKGGYLRIAPTRAFSVERRYRDQTNILETTFTGDGFKVRLTDFMPVFRRQETRQGHDVGTSRRIVRLVEGLSGEAELEVCFRPTFDYARAQAEISTLPGVGAVANTDGHFLTLACLGVTLEASGAAGLRGRFILRGGERKWVVLTKGDDPDRAREALRPADPNEQMARTAEYWEQWAAACTYKGPYREEVLRSALTLKMLAYEPTGAIVAAPTTSLPEQIGGVRNWDYRYAWLRDAALTLYALVTVGYYEEAADFFCWLHDSQRHDPTSRPQILYTMHGGRHTPESTLDHLSGYKHSQPVRIGNAAAYQYQLDVYGEVLSAADLYVQHTVPGEDARRSRSLAEALPKGAVPLHELWESVRRLANQAAAEWRNPDNGIWEVRSAPQQFVHSRLLCWTALDRSIQMAERFSLTGPLEHWRKEREAIKQAILEQGYNDELGAFTQAFGSRVLDASVLDIPRVGFLTPTDPRVRSTVDRIRSDLSENGFVYRYRCSNGLPGQEGAFALCTFWLVDALSLGGQLEEAHDLFEHVVGCANDVGLLSEEIDPSTGELLGNFPQAFSHLALIRSAVNLAKAAKHGPEEEAETEAHRAMRAGEAATEGASAR